MRNKDKAFDVLNEVCAEALPHSADQDDDTSRIEALESAIMEKLEKRIDEKLESYKQESVDNVDNNDANNDNEELGGSEDGDN